MKTKKYKTLILSLIFIYSIIFAPKAIASTLFFDDFSNSSITFNQWETQLDTWPVWNQLYSNWVIDNNAYKTVLPLKDQGSITLIKNKQFSNVRLIADVYSQSGVDQYILFRFIDSNNFYGLDIRPEWNDSGSDVTGNLLLFKNIKGIQSIIPNTEYNYYIYSGIWYRISINLINNNVDIKIINSSNNDIFSFNNNTIDITSGKIGLGAWSGAFQNNNPGVSVIKYFDNILITDNSDPEPTLPWPSPTPSTTPTPTPVPNNEKVPIIFIPGHGASWNTNQILKNEFSDNNNGWGAIPYFYNKVYGSFLAELRNEYPEQVYNFYYDWRQESSKSIDKLYRFIEDKSNKDSNKKFILIAHSYGGLIARGYLHKYGNSHIQKIITAGTPHEGVLFAYNLWEGGDVIRGKTYERFIQELPIRENQIKNITKRAAARKTAPSTKDLLPIFPYLFKDNENNPISISSMAVQNTFLQNLKSESGLEKSNEFKLFKGDGQDTVEFIKVKDRDWLDLALGNWEDGHPVSYVIYKNGDDTVLTKSSQIDGIQPITEPLSHGDLFSNEIGMRNIFNELGITISNTFHYNQNKVNKALVFVLHSPACLRITDSEKRQTGCAINSVLIPESESDENSQMAVIGNPLDNYQIEVLPVNGGGKYKLTIAEYDDNSSNYHDLSGEVLSGNTDIYNLSSIAGNYHLMPGLYLNNIKDKLSQVKEQAVNSNFDDDLKSILKLHLDKEIQLAEQIMSLEEYNDENKLVNDLETLIRLISGTRFTLANHIKNKDDNYYNIKSILYSITDDIKNLAQSSSQAHPYAYLQAQIKANSLQESLIEERLRKIADNNDIKEALIILEDARSRQNLIEQQFRDNPEKIAPIDLLIVKSYLLESSLTAGHLD